MSEVTAPAAPSAPADPTVNIDAPPGAIEERKPDAAPAEGEQTPQADAEQPQPGPEADDEGDDDEGAENQPQRKSRYQRLKARAEQERERADRLERELAATRTQSRTSVPTGDDAIKAEVERRVGAPPKPEDFPDIFAYEAERTAYLADKRAVERDVRREAEAAKASHEQAERQKMRDHNERVKAAKAEIPDFAQVVQAAAGKVYAEPFVEQLIVESPDSGRLLYHLLKNPADVERLNALSPRDAIREIGRLEARLERSATLKTTKAPAPVSPSPKGGASPTPDPNKMEMDEYVRWRQSQRK